jgi:hypothetical protein
MVVRQCAAMCRIASALFISWAVTFAIAVANRWSVTVQAGSNSLAILRRLLASFCDNPFHFEAGTANRAPLLALLISDRLADCPFSCADSFRPIEGNSDSG